MFNHLNVGPCLDSDFNKPKREREKQRHGGDITERGFCGFMGCSFGFIGGFCLSV